ncbi:MAG: chromophore lyase CpcT/CpeT [Thermosynechococcaceae cyanobacterium]
MSENLVSISETTAHDLVTLAHWMSGDFSNLNQAQQNSRDYAHIHILFRPLPFEFFSGIGLYSEQVYDYDLWAPYRQGVHRLVPQGDHIYIENYRLNEPLPYAGASRDRKILENITPDCIQRRTHCSMVFKRETDRFIGTVEPGNLCLIDKNGCSTYLDSHVEVTETTWVSLDRGMDVTTHQQVWGSEHGPLRFQKQESFAHEVPTI